MSDEKQPAKRTTAEIIRDYLAGRLDREEIQLKVRAQVDKFDMTDDGPKLVETVVSENGRIVSKERFIG